MNKFLKFLKIKIKKLTHKGTLLHFVGNDLVALPIKIDINANVPTIDELIITDDDISKEAFRRIEKGIRKTIDAHPKVYFENKEIDY